MMDQNTSPRDQKRFGQKCGQKCANVLKRKQSSNGISKNPKYKLHRREKLTIFLLTKWKNLAPLFTAPERSWKFQRDEPCHSLHENASLPTQKVALSKVDGGKPSALSEGRLSVTKREWQVRAFESQTCILHQGRNQPHDDHVADREFHSWHHYNLVHTLVPICKATEIPPVKIAVDRKWDKSQTTTSVEYVKSVK